VNNGQLIQTNTKNNNVDYDKLARIDGLVNDYINKNWLTGAVSIVIKDNQVGTIQRIWAMQI
jgi:hypothetical protein